MAKTLLVAVLILVMGQLCIAQSDSANAVDSARFDYRFNVSGFFQRGVYSTTILGGGTMISVGNKKTLAVIEGSYNYGNYSGFIGLNDFIGRAVVSFIRDRRFFLGAGLDYELSAMYNVELRAAPGLGFGYKIWTNERNKLEIHGFGSYEETRFINIDGYTTFRANAILFGEHILVPERLNINYKLFYFQSVDDKSNYRWRLYPELVLRLNKFLSATASFDYHYESVVDPNNVKENYFVTFGFTIARPK